MFSPHRFTIKEMDKKKKKIIPSLILAVLMPPTVLKGECEIPECFWIKVWNYWEDQIYFKKCEVGKLSECPDWLNCLDATHAFEIGPRSSSPRSLCKRKSSCRWRGAQHHGQLPPLSLTYQRGRQISARAAGRVEERVPSMYIHVYLLSHYWTNAVRACVHLMAEVSALSWYCNGINLNW